MKTILDRSVQPISVEAMFNAKGLMMTIHGDTPAGNTVVLLSLPEARLLAYGLLAEAEREEMV